MTNKTDKNSNETRSRAQSKIDERTSTDTNPKRGSVYEQITERIVAMLENGTVQIVESSRTSFESKALQRESPELYARFAKTSTGIGQIFALVLMASGMFLHSYWFIIAGFFIMIGAQIEDQGVFFQSVVDTVRMSEVMLTDFATLSPSDTLAGALSRCVHSLQEDFPVIRGPQLVGIVNRQRIVDALRSDGDGYIQSVMSRTFQVARPDDTLGTTIRRISAGRGLALIPVTDAGRIVGIVSVQNLMSSMSLLSEQRRLERAQGED